MKAVIKPCLALAAAVCLSGCAGLKVQPHASSIVVPKAPTAIPAVVGITHSEQKVTGGLSDLVGAVKQSLDEAALFQTLYYPVRSSDNLNGEIQLRLNGRLKADGALFPKAFLTGFFMFLPAPIVWYKHQYQAECSLDLLKDGRKIKTYVTNAAVVASHQLFASPSQLEAEGTSAATKLLGARVAEQLVNDRQFLEAQLTASKVTSAKE